MTDTVNRVILVGAGIGGLATATALGRRGIDVRILERRTEFLSGGVGLGQPANGLRGLDAIGVLDEVLEAGFAFANFKVYDHQRELIVDHRFLMGGDGIPPIAALPRRDLHRILHESAIAAGCEIDRGVEPVRFEDRGDAVEVELSDGTTDTVDLLIGFDGLNSWTRRQLFGDRFEPVYSGSAAWRLIVPRPPEVTCMEFFQGFGHKTGVMPLNADEMYLFHIRPEPDTSWREPSTMYADLRDRLADYGAVAAAVREQLSPESQITYSPIEPHFIDARWHRGRVVVGGDAAHTYPPHMTQGAAMAIEDGVVLADLVAQEGRLDARLNQYTIRRAGRCRFVSEFAGGMLRAEQAIRTPRDLDRARATGMNSLDERLNVADRIMDQDVLGVAVHH